MDLNLFVKSQRQIISALKPRVTTTLVRGIVSLAMAVFATTVSSQEKKPIETTLSFTKSFEMPAQRALQRIKKNPAASLSVFVSDGCSGGLSASWSVIAEYLPTFAKAHQTTPPWEYCCVNHDRSYHAAGTSSDPETSYSARLEADETLQGCVLETAEQRMAELTELYGLTNTEIRSAYSAISTSMFIAVRLGGGPCTGLPWRWGYGYQNCTW